jgi:hypothetical protein
MKIRGFSGLVVQAVRVCPARITNGELRMRGPCHPARAAFATGLAKTLIHPDAVTDWPIRGPKQTSPSAGGKVVGHTTVGFVEMRGCATVLTTPIINESGPRALNVDIILGDDVLELNRVVVDPEGRTARCRRLTNGRRR